MRRMLVPATVVVLLASTVLAAADPTFLGTWRLSPDRSDFGGYTLMYEALADGQLRSTRGTTSYVFRTDGKEYRTPWGVTTWKQASENSWIQTSKANGTTTITNIALSPDGKTLTLDSADAMPVSEVYRRQGDGTGLVGKWTLTKTASTFELSDNGSDGLTLRSIEDTSTCKAKLDGKDYPAQGPGLRKGSTCSMVRQGPRAVLTSWKAGGRVFVLMLLTMSSDDKTMTVTVEAEGVPKNARMVYERIK